MKLIFIKDRANLFYLSKEMSKVNGTTVTIIRSPCNEKLFNLTQV